MPQVLKSFAELEVLQSTMKTPEFRMKEKIKELDEKIRKRKAAIRTMAEGPVKKGFQSEVKRLTAHRKSLLDSRSFPRPTSTK